MQSILLTATPVLAQALPALAWWAVVFFVIAIIAYILGARGLAGFTAAVGRTLLIVFLVLAIVFAILGLATHRY